MKNLNKKMVGGLACVLFIAPSISYAGEMYSSEGSMTTTQYTPSYYDQFKREFYEQLMKGDFSQVDKRIAGYEGDVEYLSQNPESPYYANISIYQEKIDALKKLKETFKTTVKSVTTEQQENLKALKTSLEESIKSLRESITAENLDEIKAKAESLKAEYLAKAESLGLVEYKKMIEERFKIFFEANFAKREEFKKIAEQKKEELKKVAEQKKEDIKKIVEEKKTQAEKAKEELKQKMQDVKQNFKDKRTELKVKYKQMYAKKLEGKIDNFSADRLKTVLNRIEVAIQRYEENTKLTTEQKEKLIAQLLSIKEIIQEKLDEIENSVNLDELLGE